MSKWIRGEAVPPVDIEVLRAAIVVAQYDGTHPAACGPRCRSQHTDDHSQCPEQFDGSGGDDGRA